MEASEWGGELKKNGKDLDLHIEVIDYEPVERVYCLGAEQDGGGDTRRIDAELMEDVREDRRAI
eukprot:189152-Pyramimonas_sp.AAC.1